MGRTTTTAGKPNHLHSTAVHAVQRLATSIHAVQRLATSIHAVQRLATSVHAVQRLATPVNTVQRTFTAVLAMQRRATTDLAMQRGTPVHAAAEGPTKEMFEEQEKRSYAHLDTTLAMVGLWQSWTGLNPAIYVVISCSQTMPLLVIT